MVSFWNTIGVYNMTIENITFEITAVNESLRCMDVVFRATGQPDVLVGARMPFEGEDLNTLVASVAPIGYWEDLAKQVVPVSVGTTGAVTLNTPINTDNVSTM